MKGTLTLLLVAVCMVQVSAQSSTPAARVVETLRFKETNFDFGKIQQNRPVTHNFEVVNNSKEAIKIENVQASCGCTTPEWTKEAIAPGASAFIKVGYNAAAEGPFTKTISVQYNGSQSATLTISGAVYKGPTTSAPVNPSLSLLKQTNK
ncbi:MAG TPA: DUF1573 domain-containing protein [Flavitalea sp.]|nr:DUF1573 domain-containing protein [Flavitalea sp.]